MILTPTLQHWQAVVDSAPRTDFVYAVKTTGIYCLPSCSSRRPRRDNVVFFSLPESAEQAGFRACKRCKPREPQRSSQLERMRAVCRYLEEHLEESITLHNLSVHFGLSPSYLQRRFKELVGVSPQKYLHRCRENHFRQALKQGEDISQAVYAAGFSSSSQVYRRDLGMTPKSYQQGGKMKQLRYQVCPCPIGYLLVAATKRGICAVSLGDDPKRLESSFKEEFAEAQIVPDEGELASWIAAILRHLEGQKPHLDLPLDVQATAFQAQVWQALKEIPYGETRSYAEVAAQMGKPSASRAVARACATNPTALVVPCHRVVRQDGSVSGYRWGVERKAWLLQQEQKATSSQTTLFEEEVTLTEGVK